jgi:hypothetical protein
MVGILVGSTVGALIGVLTHSNDEIDPAWLFGALLGHDLQSDILSAPVASL